MAGCPVEGLSDSRAGLRTECRIERLRVEELEGEGCGGLGAAAVAGGLLDLQAIRVADLAKWSSAIDEYPDVY